MKWILICLLAGCTKPQSILGTWTTYKSDTVRVTFDSLMTVEYRRGITKTPYTVFGDSVNIQRGVMLFESGNYHWEVIGNTLYLGTEILTHE